MRNFIGECLIYRTSITTETIDSYLAADYIVNAVESFVLKIGKPSVEIDRWFKAKNYDRAAYVTAWNPLGEKIPDYKNYAAEKKLILEIESCNLFYLKGKSIDPSGVWVDEPSVLIFGILLKSAKELAKRYRQNGFVYVDSDTKPQLILL